MFRTVEWTAIYDNRDARCGEYLAEYGKHQFLGAAIQQAIAINDSYYEHDVKIEYWPEGAKTCAWCKSPEEFRPFVAKDEWDDAIPF